MKQPEYGAGKQGNKRMTEELMNLVWVSALTALLWMPYIVNSMAVRGFNETMGYPENPKPLSRWAQNMKAAQDVVLN